MSKEKQAPRGKRKQMVMHDVTMINRVSGESFKGDLLGEDTIDGRGFYIMQVGARAMKLSKEGFELKRRNR